tara:strand:- start:2440 stop:2664 length:225 start_codon:yes stop_codon:yes gene_type:complete
MPKNKPLNLSADVVNGICPTCEEHTLLVSIAMDFYRCMECGADLVQHVNGKISYLPVVHSTKEDIPQVKEWIKK